MTNSELHHDLEEHDNEYRITLRKEIQLRINNMYLEKVYFNKEDALDELMLIIESRIVEELTEQTKHIVEFMRSYHSDADTIEEQFLSTGD